MKLIRTILLTVGAMASQSAPLMSTDPAVAPFAIIAPQPGRHQFGNTVYTLPPGWELGRDDDGVQVIYSELPDDLCDYCYVYVSAGFPAEGNLTDFLLRHQGDFADDEEERASIKVMSQPELMTASGKPAAMMAITLDSGLQILVAYDLGTRHELLAFQGYAYDEDDLAESMAVFTDQITPVLDSLQFVSAGGQSLMPAPHPGTLSGLYWGTSLEQSFGIDMMVRFDIVPHSYFFWPDGQFYDGTPPSGLRPLDRAALMAAADTNFGVYHQHGTTVTLTYSNGTTKDFAASGGQLILDDLILNPTPLMDDGSRINGTIASIYYSGFSPGSGIEGGVSATSSTTFFRDGTYTGESFGGGVGSFDQGGGFATGSNDTTGGTYEVKDGLIILTPADGSASRARVIVSTSEGIMIGDEYLE